MDSAELAAEQSYFDYAEKWRRAHADSAADAIQAAANPGTAARIAKLVRRKAREAQQPPAAVAFGRMDDALGETLYIGPGLIRDGDGEALVINWTAPAARPYYNATAAEPLGIRRRREFQCSANTIVSYADVLFDALTEQLAQGAEFSDALLAELDRDHGPELRDIVATIHATQYQLISAPLDEVLVVDGGPGTGKTVVALHRISWLLANHPERLSAEQVLVVGPNPTFLSYTELVLPSLGNVVVDQRPISALAPEVRTGRTEPDELARLKGEARMAGLLARGLDARIGTPEASERLAVAGRYVTLPGDEVSRALAEARMAELPYAQRRERLRQALRALLVARMEQDPGSGRIASLDNLLERLWPQLTPAAFLADLFGSRRRLAAAGGGYFTEAELAALHRRAADRLTQQVWSDADLALLDEVDALINGRPLTLYGHVAVDEVQDFSAMQLRSVARRCPTGSMTLAGDLAQATGPSAASSWEQVLEHLPARVPARLVALRYSYRVPREVFGFVSPLLSVVAPGSVPPQPIRSGPAAPQVHAVGAGERAAEVVRLAGEHAAAGRFVGIVCPPTLREQVAAALDAAAVSWHDADSGGLGQQVNLVSPRAAKGLEFDAVVVVEPQEIVAGDPNGLRLLYVALTRTTRYLHVVCAGDPLPLVAPERQPAPAPPAPGISADEVRAYGRELAASIRRAYPPEVWLAVLQAAADELEPPAPPRAGRHSHRPS
jgi:DNA helicase IV